MNNYKGLFTFDVDNHRYVQVEQADGIISDMNYHPESEKEPKEFFAISPYKIEGYEVFPYDNFGHIYKLAEELGIAFKTKEEAEKAVEKLKAWKRLKDKGFKFEGIKEDYTRILQSQKPFRTGKRYLQFNKSEDEEWMEENWEDLDLIFGGEE